MFKSKMAKANKPLIIYGIVVACIAVVAIIFSFVYNLGLKSVIEQKALDKIMATPFTQEADNGDMLKFYAKPNKDFDKERDKAEPLKAYIYCMEKPDGSVEEFMYDDGFEYDGQVYPKGSVAGMFLAKTMEGSKGTLSTAKKAINISTTILIIGLVIAGIICWFFSWSNREDLKQEELKKSLNKQHKKR